MANPEHVEVVKQGARVIAAWRVDNPHAILDLRKADLTGADLREADLRQANLGGAVLARADLTNASLSIADLSDANLHGALLYGADLHNADLSFAYLGHADLSETVLTDAKLVGSTMVSCNLRGANLNRADLTEAALAYVSFGDTNLADAKGLESVLHGAPSTIGVDTLFASQGKIPHAFLRGCGVPEELIVQLPAIIESMEPIQFYSCFISYSSDDNAFARRVYARLKAEKLQVFFAGEDMKGGEKFADQIDTAIRVHDRLLLVLSEKSMNSEWVRREIERAREKEKQIGRNVLFPIALVPFEKIRAWTCLDLDSGEDLAKRVREYHIPDFSQWKQGDEFEKAFGDLMRDLRAKAEKESEEGAGDQGS